MEALRTSATSRALPPSSVVTEEDPLPQLTWHEWPFECVCRQTRSPHPCFGRCTTTAAAVVPGTQCGHLQQALHFRLHGVDARFAHEWHERLALRHCTCEDIAVEGGGRHAAAMCAATTLAVSDVTSKSGRSRTMWLYEILSCASRCVMSRQHACSLRACIAAAGLTQTASRMCVQYAASALRVSSNSTAVGCMRAKACVARIVESSRFEGHCVQHR